ncbi:MAG: VOC family protein, partial [Sulfurifustaceae bacterium]
MSLRIRQIVLAANDLDRTVEDVAAVLGVRVAFRDPLVAKFGLHNALLPIGEQFVEVVAPTRPGTAAGRLLERRGDSGYMLLLQTDDFARDRARMERLGV